MEFWRYYEVTHALHDLMNPSTGARVDEMGDALRLRSEHRVLDLGCGHAEMLLRWNERFGISGVGVDASPYHSARAIRRVEERGLAHVIEIQHGKGEAYATEQSFDVAACVGASWIFDGHAGTLRALTGFTRPGGAVVVGEPYWLEAPPPEYLAAEDLKQEQFHDLGGCLDVARAQGLELVWMARSTGVEWDRYEMLQAAALDAFAIENPDDPDLAALRRERRRYDESYVRWGHRCLGWALWAFRVPLSV